MRTLETPGSSHLPAPQAIRADATALLPGRCSSLSGQAAEVADLQVFQALLRIEPSTRSLPWRFRGVTRVPARSSATQFLLGLLQAVELRRETSCVSFLMCPFCVRALLPG